ncbi:MAG: ribonuclease III [Chloroflexi bacterium]|nr:ribonuclease III [Chloroflexota bacterium]MBP8058141.1 ribonuclease III [Chloroflexota bacterium]
MQDYSLLSRALTHRSYLNERPDDFLEDNERLEFLGDAVLDFVVGAYLYHRFPEMDEGGLTALRASLVRTETLAGFARDIGLGQFLRLGLGEADSGGRNRNHILCGAFEAVMGAVYLDQGLEKVREIVGRLAPPKLEHIMAQSLYKDAKSEFQVWAQAEYNITPRYIVIASEGPDHAKMFTTQVLVGDTVWGIGGGRSKQLAAQAAAADALLRTEEYDDNKAIIEEEE